MRGRAKVFDKLGGGVNLVDGYNSGADEAEDALNVTSDGLEGWRSRKGSYLVAPDALPGGFQGQFRLFAAPLGGPVLTDHLIAYQWNRPLSSLTNAVTFDFITAISVSDYTTSGLYSQIGPSDYAPPQFIVAPTSSGQGPVYFMNDPDSDTPFKKYWSGVDGVPASGWTGSTTAVPDGHYLIYANNRVFILNRDGTLTASGVGDPREWNLSSGDAWAIELPPNGEFATGLGVAGDYVLAFQESVCWVIYDSETGANRRLDDAPGCGSHWSITPSPFGTFFLGRDRRVYRTDGQSTKSVGRKIQPLLDGVRMPSITAPENDAARGFFVGDSYYLAGTFDGDELTLEYDVKADAWWIHDQFGEVVSLGGELYVAGGGGLCSALSLEENLDADDPFTSRWRSSQVAFGSPGVNSRVRAVDMDGAGDGVRAGMSMDGADAVLDPTTAVAENLCPDPQLDHNGILWNYTNIGDPSYAVVTLGAGGFPDPPLDGVTKAAWLSADTDETLVYFQSPVQDGAEYTVSMYVYLDDASAGATGARLEARNAAGTVKASSSTFTTLDTWTRLSVTVTADEDATWSFGVAAVDSGLVVVMATAALLELGDTASTYPLGARRDLSDADDRRILAPGVAKTWALEVESNRQMSMKSWTAWVDPRKD